VYIGIRDDTRKSRREPRLHGWFGPKLRGRRARPGPPARLPEPPA